VIFIGYSVTILGSFMQQNVVTLFLILADYDSFWMKGLAVKTYSPENSPSDSMTFFTEYRKKMQDKKISEFR